MSTRAELAGWIVRASHALHQRGWVANHDGNVSVRLDDGRFLVTPTAISKLDVREGNLAVVDVAGRPVEGDTRPPSEFALHLGAYAVRPDVHAVVHAHPPYATAMACAGVKITTFLPEAIISIGPEVPIAPFAVPSGEPGAAPIKAMIPSYDALLLCRHGVITVGPNVELALLRMELVEHMARIHTLALPHGGVRALPEDVLRPLIEKRRKANLGLAAERTPLPGEEPGATVAAAPPVKIAGPAPAPDAWSGGKTEGACGVVYGAGGGNSVPSGRNEELGSIVRSAVHEHLRGK
jgi:L-fuculose-phosphate aldolase